jgi:rRNA-processing protein FCF1
MRDIILDTNFLTAPFQMNISIFREIDEKFTGSNLYTLDEVMEEARSIESGKYGGLVEELVESQEIEVLETEGSGDADDLLVDLSDRFLIATNDKELKSRIIKKGRPVLIIRNSKYIEAVNSQV